MRAKGSRVSISLLRSDGAASLWQRTVWVRPASSSTETV